jgi:hypothetical protein
MILKKYIRKCRNAGEKVVWHCHFFQVVSCLNPALVLQQQGSVQYHWSQISPASSSYVHTLGYGFLSQSPCSLFGNHKHLTKVLRLLVWFGFSLDFKNP